MEAANRRLSTTIASLFRGLYTWGQAVRLGLAVCLLIAMFSGGADDSRLFWLDCVMAVLVAYLLLRWFFRWEPSACRDEPDPNGEKGDQS